MHSVYSILVRNNFSSEWQKTQNKKGLKKIIQCDNKPLSHCETNYPETHWLKITISYSPAHTHAPEDVSSSSVGFVAYGRWVPVLLHAPFILIRVVNKTSHVVTNTI